MPTPLKPGDKILLAALALALACGAAWWAHTGGKAPHTDGGTEKLLVVTQTKDGQRRVDPLSISAEFTIDTPGTGMGADASGGENGVRIHNGAVEVTRSTCSNQLCVKHEPISQPGDQIVCLPHGLVIEVVERERDAATLQ